MSEVSDIFVRPLTGRIGAEICGVDLSRDLPQATIGEIRRVLLEDWDKGFTIVSLFFNKCRAILLADLGPKPGNLEISFINSSISFTRLSI